MSDCKTPGAFYHFDFKPDGLSVSVDATLDLTPFQAREVEAQLHHAVENVLAPWWDVGRASAPRCKGCAVPGEPHTKACPFNRQGNKRVDKVQTKVSPV